MRPDREQRAEILAAIVALGLEEPFREAVTQHRARVGNVLGIVKDASSAAARGAWWRHLSVLGWTDEEIARLHHVARRTVSDLILRQLRRSA